MVHRIQSCTNQVHVQLSSPSSSRIKCLWPFFYRVEILNARVGNVTNISVCICPGDFHKLATRRLLYLMVSKLVRGANLALSCARRKPQVPLGLVPPFRPVRHEKLYLHSLKAHWYTQAPLRWQRGDTLSVESGCDLRTDRHDESVRVPFNNCLTRLGSNYLRLKNQIEQNDKKLGNKRLPFIKNF